MTYFKQFNSTTSLWIRPPRDLDSLLEEMVRRERRTKTCVLSLSLEEHAEKHHPDLFAKYKEKEG